MGHINSKDTVERVGDIKDCVGRVQTSVRLKAPLFHGLREKAKASGESVNAIIEALVDSSLRMSVQQMEELGRAPAVVNYKVPRLKHIPGMSDSDVQDPNTRGEPPIDPKIWRLRQFFRWLPCATVIRDMEGVTVLANPELRRVVGRTDVEGKTVNDYWEPPAAAWIEEHDRFVREHNVAIVCRERVPIRSRVQERLAIRFPIRAASGQITMTAVVSFDLGQLQSTEILKSRDRGRRPSRLPAVVGDGYAGATADSLLMDFVQWIPAIAVAKDMCGHLLSVNERFYAVTHKTSDVIGRLPAENWSPETADLITAHDQLVRETGAPFLSVETITTEKVSCERLNLRFPMFAANNEMEMTGVLGFDYGLIVSAIDRLTQTEGYKEIAVFEPDQSNQISFERVEPRDGNRGRCGSEWFSVNAEASVGSGT